MTDLISRRAAIEHLKKRLYETALNNDTEHPYYEEMADNRVSVWLEELPSVEPKKFIEDYCKPRNLMVVGVENFRLFTEQKPGKWIYPTDIVGFGRCANCKALWSTSLITNKFVKYCPRCGHPMKMSEERSEE